MHKLRYKAIHLLSAAFIAMAVMMSVAGCVNDSTSDLSYSVPGDLKLTLTTLADATRTDGVDENIDNGETLLNENLINRAQLFFYVIHSPGGPKDDEPAVYSCKVSNLNANYKKEVMVRLNNRAREELFGANLERTRCRVVAVVNLPDNVSIDEKASVDALRAAAVTANFRLDNGAASSDDPSSGDDQQPNGDGITEEDIARYRQPEFVMLGEGVAEFEDVEKRNLKGIVPLKRTAAKIRLALNIEESVKGVDPNDPKGPEKDWEPMLNAARVYITNGVSKGLVGGGRLELEEGDYYSISASGNMSSDKSDYMTLARRVFDHKKVPQELQSTVDDGEGGTTTVSYSYWHDIPFYSYPHSWTNTPEEEHQTCLVLQIPWKVKDEQNYMTFFYQIPVNARGGQSTNDRDNEGADDNASDNELGTITSNSIESNMYYLIKLHVGMLGSYNPEEPVEIDAHYYIVPWQDEVIEAELRDNRYLVVNQPEWPMNNITDIDIPFYTSHKAVVARVKYHFWNYNPVGTTGNDRYIVDNENPDNIIEAKVEYDGKPLERVVTWRRDNRNGINSVFNKTVEKAMTGADRNTPMPEDSMFRWSIDNKDLVIHYHHDLERWTEYTDNDVEVWGAKERQAERHWWANNREQVAPSPKTVPISGFYGQKNGETAYLRRTTNHEPEWSKIKIEITIIHEDLFEEGKLDNTRFQQTIIIYQYPPMYIETELSRSEDQLNSSGKSGSVWVDGNRSPYNELDYESNWLGAVTSYLEVWKGVTSGVATNSNPNMYVINISQLSESEGDYSIGDPRTLVINNDLRDNSFNQQEWSSNWVTNGTQTTGTAYYVGDESAEKAYDWAKQTRNWKTKTPTNSTAKIGNSPRTIRYYYPTDEASGAGSKENFIAPRLRVASSYGSVAGQLTRVEARRRCATYQEAGYPAGRWRLPTKAEITFISNLSRMGRIPTLFATWQGAAVYAGTPYVHQDDSPYRNYPHYWCAQGAAYIDDDTGAVNIYPDKVYIDRGADKTKDAASVSANSAQVAVRCVYDEWYWEDKCPEGTFTWGDKPKSNPQDDPTKSVVKGVVNMVKNR